MKNFIKSIVFIIIFLIIFCCVFKVLWLGKTYVSFLIYDEPKNSSDIVYIGSSAVYTYFNPVLAYDLYGFTTCFCATGSQPFNAIKYLLKETQKYQNPELYIIDLATSIEDWDFFDEGAIRRTTDSMKFSKNRIDAINEILKYKGIDKKDYINYYFSFLRYHDIWRDITKENFTKNEYSYKGFILSPESSKNIYIDEFNWKDDIMEISAEKKQILMELIEYIKVNNLNVLFVVPKRGFEEEIIKQLNNAIEIIKESGLDIINFNTLEDFSVNYATDFYNTSHVNIYGATKYTLYLSKYLNDHYDLPNHNGDEAYNSWENEYVRFKQDFKALTKKDFNKILTKYSN